VYTCTYVDSAKKKNNYTFPLPFISGRFAVALVALRLVHLAHSPALTESLARAPLLPLLHVSLLLGSLHLSVYPTVSNLTRSIIVLQCVFAFLQLFLSFGRRDVVHRDNRCSPLTVRYHWYQSASNRELIVCLTTLPPMVYRSQDHLSQ